VTVTATIFSVAGFKAGIGYIASTFFGSILKSFAVNFLLSALTSQPKVSAGQRGYLITANGSALDHQVIYGKMRVAGARVFDATTGGDNKYLHRILAFSGHEIEAFDEIYLNDEIVTLDANGNVTAPAKYLKSSTRYVRQDAGGNACSGSEEDGCFGVFVTTATPLITIKKHFGSANQVADADLVTEFSGESTSWTTNHRLRGIAYLYVKFTYDSEAFPSGLPEITAVIKGKKLYDPRTSITSWSDNPALCIRDYIVSTYGLLENSTLIDDTAVATAANVCDQFVELSVQKMIVGHEYKIKTVGNTDFSLLGAANSTVGTVFIYNPTVLQSIINTLTGVVECRRYTTNGAFTTEVTPGELLTNILTSMCGLLWYAQGQWRMKAASFTTSVMSLDENDLRSGIKVSTRHSRRDNYSEVKGTFRGRQSNYQVTDYPPVTNAAFLVADNNQKSVADIDLPFTDNVIEARRIARIMLESNRQQISIQASFGMRALALQVGDTVSITNERFSWSNKLFQVENWAFGLDENLSFGVELGLKETAASVYDEFDDGVIYEQDNTNLLSPFIVPNVGVAASTELREVRGKLITVLLIDVTVSSVLVDQVEVQYRKSSETNYSHVSVSSGEIGTLRSEIVGVAQGYYDIRARAINALGIRGSFTEISNFYVDALATPPGDVTNFSGNVVGSSLHLNWTPVAGLDVGFYNLRYSNQTSGATFSFSEALVQVDKSTSSVTVPAAAGTYFIKAVDSSTSVQISSVNAASFVVADLGISDFDSVATVSEHPDFLGTKTNTIKDSNNKLVLAQSGGNFVAEGIYYFANKIDLGQKYTARISSDVSMVRFDQTSTFDSASGTFDARAGLFDGDPDAFDDVSFQMEERHTNDDPTGVATYTNWLPFAVTDLSARAFEFRIKLTSTNTQASPQISALSASVSMPDVTLSENNISCTGSRNITFTRSFQLVPGVSLSIQNLADGDRYTITSKTRLGFTINIFTGSAVSTNTVIFDYVAKGFGKELI